jgi:NAD(P)-dependent dehydrogenase (short-subunit alcohol dehydrogenase family)
MGNAALITGASRGLGAELATFLAAQNYGLVLTARRADDLAAFARTIRDRDCQVIAIAGDVADAEHRRRLIAAAEGLGGIDLLVNNASELGPSPLPALGDLPLAVLERIFAVNVLAPLGLIQAALPMLATRKGLIVNLSSDAASGGYAGWGGYGASKAALDLLSATLANELKSRGVAVVAVDPGDMRTAMHQAAYPGEDISNRPLPEVTIPFWAWLLGQARDGVSGRRYRAQDATWEVQP